MTRGRSAQSPNDIPQKGWRDVALRVYAEIGRDRVGLIAAGIAFYGLLALFPAISALVAIFGLFADPQQVTEQINQMAGLIPQQATDLIAGQVAEVTGSRRGGLGIAALLGLGIAIYSASAGTASLMQGMNTAYDEEEKRGFIKKYAVRLGLTVFLVLGAGLGIALILAVPAAIAFLDMGPWIEAAGSVLAYALLLVLAAVGLAVLYRYAPSRDAPQFRWVSAGAVLACLLWVVASAGFAFYVSNFGTYNETFGTLAGVIVLLMWFWISAFIVLLGAEVNAEIEAQTRRDTTVGETQPMGERGAVKADRLGDRP